MPNSSFARLATLGFAVAGLTFAPLQAQAAPDIEILGNGEVISSGSTIPSTGSHTDFGPVFLDYFDPVVDTGVSFSETPAAAASTTPTRSRLITFTIRNSGDTVLNLTGTSKVMISGPNSARFTPRNVPTAPIEPGQDATFQINYYPSSLGLHKATVSVASDDPDESPYTFAIQGTAIRPETEAFLFRRGPEVNGGVDIRWSLTTLHDVSSVKAENFSFSTTGTLTGAQITQIFAIPQSPLQEKDFIIYATTTGGEGTVTLNFVNDTGMTHKVTNTVPPVSFTINRTPPVISTPPASVTRSAGTTGLAVLGDLTQLVTATDPQGATLSQSPVAATLLEAGTHPVTLSAIDSVGNRSSVQTQVIVSFAPVTGPGAITPSLATGSLAPGAGDSLPTDAKITAFFTPALDNRRSMAARVTVTAGKKKLLGIYQVNGAGTATLPALQGQAVPSPLTQFTFKSFLDPVLSESGSLAFVATMAGAKSTEDEGVWTDVFGPLEMVLREGHNTPGLPGGVGVKSVTSISLREGSLIALVKLAPWKPGVTAGKDDVALIELTDSTIGRMLLRTGMSYGGSTIKSIATLAPASGSPGHGRWHGEEGILAKVTLTNKEIQLVTISSGGDITPLLSTSEAADAIDPAAKWKSFAIPAMGGATEGFAVAASLQPKAGGVTSKNDVAVLFSQDGAEWEAFAREGELTPISSASNAPRFATFFDPVVNQAGQVAFLATLAGPSVTPENKTVLLAGAVDDLAVAARLGDAVPDANGQPTTAVWSKFVSYALPETAGAGALFLAETSGGDTTSKNKLGLWATDQSGQLRRILRTGTATPQNGPFVTGISLLTAVPGSYGTARSFNQHGSIAVLAAFEDKSQKLLRIDLP